MKTLCAILLSILSLSQSFGQFAQGTLRIQRTITVGPPSAFDMPNFGAPPASSGNYILGFNGASGSFGGPAQFLLGANMSWNSSTGNLEITGFEPTLSAGLNTQYYRGDKSWQTLDKSAVGLANVDNTSDANKPVSTAQQTAIDAKVQNNLGASTTIAPSATAVNTALTAKFDSPSGTVAQYLRGNGSPATFPTNISSFTNDSAYITQSGARSAFSVTTTGSSGAATYNSSTGVFNIPQYGGGTGTVTSIGISSSDLSVSGSPVTNSGNITVNLSASGVSASTYSGITVNSKGIVTAGTARSFNNTATKTLVTSATGQGGVVIDASRDAAVTYSISTSTTATIGGNSSVTIYLEIAATNSATAGDWTAIQTVSNGQNITLAVALQSIQSNTLTVSGIVPAGQYMRIRYAVTGTASATYINGQEVKL